MIRFLETARLFLRPLEDADAEGPYPSWLNDGETCAGMRHHVYPYTRQQALTYIRQLPSDKSNLTLAIALKEDQRHVGNISLRDIDPVHRSAELGILLGDPDVRGQGIALEACQAVVHHAFTALNLHRINCGTISSNQAMISVARKLGFRQEGIQREALFKGGRYVDVIVYGLLASDYTG